ncbi:MAG: FAD-dependent oxidoreductase [Pseudomonadota bacterium]
MNCILIGAGHSHLCMIRDCHEPLRKNLTLISPHQYSYYSGMIPGWIAGHYGLDELRIDLAEWLPQKGLEWIQSSVTQLDVYKKIIHHSSGQISYDIASLNTGIISDLRVGDNKFFEKKQFTLKNWLPVKPIEDFVERCDFWLKNLNNEIDKVEEYKIVIVGSGLAAIELFCAIAIRIYATHIKSKVKIIWITADKNIATELPLKAQLWIKYTCEKLSIIWRDNFRIQNIEPIGDSELIFISNHGETITAHFGIGAVGGHISSNFLTPLAHSANPKRWLVKDTLQSVSNPSVFAVGDCAFINGHPLPMSGVHAVRQAKTLRKNIDAQLNGRPLISHNASEHALKLVTLGEKKAIAAKWGICTRNKFAWYWKRWIDQRYMKSFK